MTGNYPQITTLVGEIANNKSVESSTNSYYGRKTTKHTIQTGAAPGHVKSSMNIFGR